MQKEDAQPINDYVFMKLGTSHDVNGEPLTGTQTMEAYMRSIEEHGETWFSTMSLSTGMNKKKVSFYNDAIRSGETVKMFFAIGEGEYTRSGEGNDLFSNTKSVKRIICPSKNSYAKVKEIEKAIIDNCEDRVVLLMLGPTAKVIVDDLNKIDNQLIDIGHIDSEYEWFKMGATKKVKLKDKHTAEFNYDKNIKLPKDEKFQKQICEKIY